MVLCSRINTILLLLCVELCHGSLRFSKLRKPLDQADESSGGLGRASPKPQNGHLPLPLFRETLTYANQIKRSQRTREFKRQNFGVSTESLCPERCSCKYRQEATVLIVDCSSRGLRAIPTLPPIAREVYLQNNSINSLPRTTLKELKSLIQLDLSNNSISSIDPFVFSDMIKLEWLSLSKNNIAKVLNNTFQGMASLQFLSLQGNMLRYLPETFEAGAFRGLRSLQTLLLEGNQPTLVDNLTYPDQALSYIPSLQKLSLDGYPRALGPGFRSLHQLSSIIFASQPGGFCRFQSELPADFFSNLRTNQSLYLQMSSCSIKTIPPDLFKFVPTIHTLDLSSNNDLKIEGFEKGSMGLENSMLTVLNISYLVPWRHPVKSVIRNTTFRHLKTTSLKTLVVENCQLTDIDPQAILDLPQTVEYISFSKNEAFQWTEILSLLLLRKLRVFKLSLQYVHGYGESDDLVWTSYNSTSGQTNSTSLKYDDTIPHSRLTARPNRFSRPRFLSGVTNPLAIQLPLPLQLEELYVNDNFLVSTACFQLTIYNNKVLRHLDVSSNNIRCWGGPIYGVPSLQYLDLSKNYCSRLHHLAFSNLTSLRTMLLSQNMLGQSLSTDIKGLNLSALVVLETLDLSSNEIEQLPQLAFKNNVNLKVLNLAHNALGEFLPNFAYNRKLEILDLSLNSLRELPESTCKQLVDIKKSSANFTVNITGNDGLLCNCDNLYFPKFLLDHPYIFSDVMSLGCLLPNGTSVSYVRLEEVLPELELECMAQTLFDVVLVAFFVLAGIVSISGVYQYKRWQLTYLYYVGKSRLHIGSMILNYRPVAHAFVTYDQVSIAKHRLP